MNIIIPQQTVQVPDVDLTPINSKLVSLEARVAKLEASPVPVPPVPPVPPVVPPVTPPITGGMPAVFGPNTFWMKKLEDNAPLSPRSAALISRLMFWTKNADPWINEMDNSGDKRTPRYVVTNANQKVSVFNTDPYHANYWNTKELAAGINWPSNVVPGGGTDKHIALYNTSTDTLYEFYQLVFKNNKWECRAAGILHNASTSDGTFAFENKVWNSSSASHVPHWLGLITKAGLAAGNMGTCLSLKFPKAAKNIPFVWPAKGTDQEGAAQTDYDPNAWPMGTRARFPADIQIKAGWTPLTKTLVSTVRDHGTVLMDTTYGWSLSFSTERDPSVGNNSILAPHMGGRQLWDIMGSKTAAGEFPWNLLQVLA